MSNIELIESIKEQGRYGILIEVGAGCPVYNELCNYPNTASKTVKYCESPNSIKYNHLAYGTDSFRAVSAGVCFKFIETARFYSSGSESDPVNYVLVNTIQIANDEKTQSHGWFGLFCNDKTIYYHFSINGFMTRPEQIKIIASIGLDILNAGNDCSKLVSGYIDVILDENYNPLKRELLDSIVNGKINKKNVHDHFVVFTPDGKVIRINDYLRKAKKNIAVFKGSFNPIHPHHIQMVQSMHSIVDCDVMMLISMSNRNSNKNGDITSENLEKRIKLMNEMGYTVCINHFPLYHYAYTYLINHIDFVGHSLHFIMGADILSRFLEDEYIFESSDTEYLNKFIHKWNDCTIHYSSRPGSVVLIPNEIKFICRVDIMESNMSSTVLRDRLKQKDFSGVKEILGDELADMMIKHYGKEE